LPSKVESADLNVTKSTKTADIPKPTDLPLTKIEIKEKSEIKAQEPSQVNSEEISPIKIKKNGRQIVIAIDAGHGGEDPGARGANGSHEKDVTLMIAKKLKEKIDSEPNMRGVLTRDSDFFIPLHGRVVKARNMQADLFVSIHADAFTNQLAKGSSVFALSERGATSASARYLAKKENESDLIGGVSLDDKDPLLAKTLLDLSQTATISDSLKLGKAVLTQIGAINALHTSRVEQAAFAVLKSPDIPSILVETAFISNPEEERRLNDVDYQDKLVTSILTGIKKYFSTNPALAKTKVALE
jgi:N-acetylmuramoyl-L-alanine amidase